MLPGRVGPQKFLRLLFGLGSDGLALFEHFLNTKNGKPVTPPTLKKDILLRREAEDVLTQLYNMYLLYKVELSEGGGEEEEDGGGCDALSYDVTLPPTLTKDTYDLLCPTQVRRREGFLDYVISLE